MDNKLIKGTVMLYGMTAAKTILPLITLPYLTRVLSSDAFGVVAYVKACMSYMQLLIDFGFVFSATKAVALAKFDKNELGRVFCNTVIEKLLLSIGAFVVLIILISQLKILQHYARFTLLYYLSIVLSILIADFFFLGIEKMEMVTIPYTVAKSFTTACTLLLVKSDSDLLIIPILEIGGTLLATVVVLFFLKKFSLPLSISALPVLWSDIKNSFVYFLSNFATTFLGAFTTIVAGIALSLQDVAHWSVCMQIVSLVKVMYTPVTNSLYPHMIQHPEKGVIIKTVKLLMPVITLGCIFTFAFSDLILTILGGAKYTSAGEVLRWLVPVLFVSFPSMLLGWPTLGAIGKERETSATTVLSAAVQIVCLSVLMSLRLLTLPTLALSCCLAEFTLFIARYIYYRRNAHLLN